MQENMKGMVLPPPLTSLKLLDSFHNDATDNQTMLTEAQVIWSDEK